MIHIYYIILLVLTAITTLHTPKLIARYNAYRTRLKHKRNETLRTMIREEIKNILLELKNEK
jgi:hypothetical protein